MLSAAAPVTLSAERMTDFTDVPAGAWFEGSAAALVRLGALDTSEKQLRPNDLAKRAELVKLLVRVKDAPLVYPAQQSFSDVPSWAWYFPYFETAAQAGWVRGDGNCFPTGVRPCTARPSNNVNRAEAAALLVRTFDLAPTGAAPRFSDIWTGAWFTDPIQTAADHCILQGDGGGTRVRPADLMNRAEMIVMFDRASQNLAYGRDCGPIMQPLPALLDVEAIGRMRLRLSFNDDLQLPRAEDPARYVVVRQDTGVAIDVTDALLVNNRTVELTLNGSMRESTSYRVSVSQLLTTSSQTFSDTQIFHTSSEVSPALTDVRMVDGTHVRLSFNADLQVTRSEETVRYTVQRMENGNRVTVRDATLLSMRTVELELSQTLLAGQEYRVNVLQLITADGDEFSDDMTFTTPPAPVGATITSVAVVSPTRIVVTFTQDLNEQRAEERFRYGLSGEDGAIQISLALQLSNRAVELQFSQELRNQEQYTVSASGLVTADGAIFSDTHTFVFEAGSMTFRALMNGTHGVPPVATLGTGTGNFTLSAQGLTYDITVKDLSGSFTAAHFHMAPAGSNGNVVEPISFVSGRAQGIWTDITAGERSALLSEDIYVNVHTDAYPNGEIRGQVRPQ